MSCSQMKLTRSQILQGIRSIVPSLTHDLHKGQCGRIGIIGGSEEYTGAPYFAGISALKTGADIAHVFCSKSSGPIIKSYSPELIVHPLLDVENAFDSIKAWIPRIHSFVVGPGLGRQPATMACVKRLIQHIQELKKPMVIDADGLHLITEDPSILTGSSPTVLTPNIVEFKRLQEKLGFTDKEFDLEDEIETTMKVSQKLNNITIVRKGLNDLIVTGDKVLVCDMTGSKRRCGGQGDLLSGVAAVFLHWSINYDSFKHHQVCTDREAASEVHEHGVGSIAGYAGCYISKSCAERAFVLNKRSTTTTDMLPHISAVFQGYFDQEISKI